MKRYLTIVFAVLAISAIFTACSHDKDLYQPQESVEMPQSQEQIKKDKVEYDGQLHMRKMQLQDQMLKRKLELQDKLLSYLKEHSEEPTSEDNETQPRKEFSDTYTSTLKQAIKDTDNLFNSVLVNDGKEA